MTPKSHANGHHASRSGVSSRRGARLTRPVAAGLLVALALASCTGGEDAAPPTPAPPSLPMPTAVTGDDLAIMVLPREELGAAADGLEVDAASSGPSDNEGAAGSSIDPEDTGVELERAERMTGYELDYVDPGLTSLTQAVGVYEVGTRVHLFRTRAAASAFLAKQKDDFVRLDDVERQDGVRLQSVTTFPVEGLGGEAFGVTASIAFQGVATNGTFVAFRTGRIVGTAGLLRGGRSDDVELVSGLARALERRVEGVLSGRIADEPEPIPDRRQGLGPPPGEVDVASMALAVEDLPRGAGVSEEGYVAGAGTVATFRRVFALTGSRLGEASLAALESDVRLFDSAVQASFVMQSLGDSFPDEAEAVMRKALDGERTTPFSLRIAPITGYDVGDAVAAYDAAVRTSAGERHGTFVFVQIGRAIGSVFAVTEGPDPPRGDVAPLVGILVTRMESAFRA